MAAYFVAKKVAKLLNVKVNTALDVIECILLVCYGFKRANLAEVTMSGEQASNLWTMLQVALNLNNGCLSIVLLGEDVMFVSLDQAILCAERSVLIDLDQTPPSLAPIDSITAMLSSLIDSLKCINNESGAKVAAIAINSELYRSLGGPCIAGLLLGYPVVYKASPQFLHPLLLVPSYSEASSKLSFTNLTKIEITAEVTMINSKPRRRNIMEFTYPSQFESELESLVSSFWESYQASISSRSVSEGDVIKLESLELVKSMIATGGISL